MQRKTSVVWENAERRLSFDILRKKDGNMEIRVYGRSPSSVSNDLQDQDWLTACKHTLFENQIDFLKDIVENEYDGNTETFLDKFLRPLVSLVDHLKAIAQDHFEDDEDLDPPWQTRFENFISAALHPRAPDVHLHKGDFLLQVSSPGNLELRYFDSGSTHVRQLQPSDITSMLLENWAEKLRLNAKSRFLFLNCIVRTKRKYEKRTWRQVVGFLMNEPQSPVSESDVFGQSELKRLPSLDVGNPPEHILDVDFEIVYSGTAILPGSRDKRGGPVIFIDTGNSYWERPDTDSSVLLRLLMYFYIIPRDESRKLGCSLVVDARRGKNVRDVLECIGDAITLFQDVCRGAVHMAYVLVRKDSLLLLFGSSKVREKLNFDFKILSSVEKLSRDIAKDQLPETFGGSFQYDHESWIKFRTKLEPFMTGCRSAAKHAMNSMQDLSRTDLGVTGDDCRRLLEQHQMKVRTVLEDSRLTALREEGLKIIERIHENEDGLQMTDDYKDTIDCVNKLFSQMNQVFEKLKVFSEKRTRTLSLCLKIRTFQEHSDQLLHWIHNDGDPFLDNHSDIADNIKHAEKLQKQFDDFAVTAESKTAEIESLEKDGQILLDLGENLGDDHEWLEERMTELDGALHSFSSRFDDRKKKLNQNTQFHELYKEAHDWWLKSLSYVANVDLQMDDVQTREGILQLKLEFEKFLDENPALTESQLAKITQLAHHLGSKQLKMEAEQIITRCKEAEELFHKKLNTILGAEKRFMAADVATVSDEASSGFCKDDDLSTESGDDSKDAMDSMPIYSWRQDTTEFYNDNDELIAAFNAKMSPKMKQRLKFIVEEMIATEHDYVCSLEYILKNYLPEMEQKTCPPTLTGKKNILFGNIERIYDFHKRYFSQELETFQHSPLEIGKCFLKWERQFYLYALYNKNKPKSDLLMDDYGNAYFAGKQRELQDKLNLASYLIKPVQRLGKYSLLLKDMINCCVNNDPRISELVAAQDMMKFQLRHGNDLLAMDCIRECDVNLREQGCLLRQGDFIVWYGRRKRVRRVFLFEHLVLFTKPKKRNAQGDIFLSKHCMKNADVGLTENIGESGLKFELWYRRWRKTRRHETFVLQAPTHEVKDAWVSEIVKILWRQAQRNKDYGITEMTTGISVESQGSGIFMEMSSSSTPINNSMHGFLRSKALSDSGVQNVKRLSWLSGESSNSSGIFDLGGVDDSFASPSKDDDCRSADIKLALETASHSPASTYKDYSDAGSVPGTANALIDRPLTAIHRRDADIDPSFIRTTIYRRTLHVEKAVAAKTEKNLKASRRHTLIETVPDNKELASSAPDLKLSNRLINLPEASPEEEAEAEKLTGRIDKNANCSRVQSTDAAVSLAKEAVVDGPAAVPKKKTSKDLGRKIPQFFKKKK